VLDWRDRLCGAGQFNVGTQDGRGTTGRERAS